MKRDRKTESGLRRWLRCLVRKSVDDRLNALATRKNLEELSLYRYGDGTWCLMIGNPTSWVLLGEVSGVHNFDGITAESVIAQAESFFANAEVCQPEGAKKL